MALTCFQILPYRTRERGEGKKKKDDPWLLKGLRNNIVSKTATSSKHVQTHVKLSMPPHQRSVGPF